MPAGHILNSPTDSSQSPDESVALQIQQAKRCSACQGPLNADVSAPSGQLYTQESSVCSACREGRLVHQQQQQQQQCAPFMVCPTASAVVVQDGARDIDVPLRVLQRTNGNVVPMRVDRHHEAESSSSSDEDIDLHDEERDKSAFTNKSVHVGPSVPLSNSPAVPLPISTSTSHVPYPQQCNLSPISISPPPTLRLAQPRSPVRQTYQTPSETHSSIPRQHELRKRDYDDGYPDPLVDITRLRVRSKGYRCLQAGATFQGTQKSGRNSYDVNVTIVDVDFAASSLCGYLRIRGLTDDWPELTTYFDAQIIGLHHGFETGDWGASRQEDMVHWARFPPFRAVQKDLIEPRMLLPANTARPAVFMRWKERFLVPDHRVQDISGASFAGFYYVCVEFDPQPGSSQSLEEDLPVYMDNSSTPIPSPPPYPNALRHHGSRRKSGVVPASVWDDAELAANGEPPKARMCGFYYHKNSEPYQQLSLTHVENRFHSSFEFR